MKKLRILLIIGCILIAAIVLLPVIKDLILIPPSQTTKAQLDPQRIKLMQPERMIKSMNLRQGVTLLDLGAGRGLFTFKFSDVVGNNGRIFATDIDPRIINYLDEQINSKGITNVFPVLVQTEDLDPFYLKHTFDVIFTCDVVPLIPNVEDFFHKLVPSLKPETGRLWIMVLKLDPDFHPVEFGDFTQVLNELRSNKGRALFFNRLNPEVKKALRAYKEIRINETLQNLIIEDLNRLLEDSNLWPDLEHQNNDLLSILNPREKTIREYLISEINQKGSFSSIKSLIDPAVRPSLRLLNRLLIQDFLKIDAWENAFSLDKLPWDQWQTLLQGRRNADAILNIDDYQLVKQHYILRYHQVWELKRKIPTK